MQEVQTEVQDRVNSSPEDIVGTVSVSGTPVIITRSDSKDMTWVMVRNPSKGIRANNINAVLYVTIDGQAPSTKGVTLARGEWASFAGMVLNTNGVKIDSNYSGAHYEIVSWG